MSVALPVEQAAVAETSPPRARLDSVDALRGLVMVIMALDHTRDFFSNAHIDPTDLKQTTVALFLTRWITHFCAPVFVFLAGTGAFLMQSRGKTKREMARFLLTRGLWIVFLELFVVGPSWAFRFALDHLSVQVFWAIGWSLVALSALIFLPRPALLAFVVVMIVGHNALDGIQPDNVGAFRNEWIVLHTVGAIFWRPGYRLFVLYPLIPWIGVMAAGYLFGIVLRQEAETRKRTLQRLGTGLLLGFVALTALNRYGDPHPWQIEKNGVFTALGWLNKTKYPPSLQYLLMTLGPAILLLSALPDRITRPVGRVFVTFGRVPLFYYLLHVPLIHGLSLLVGYFRYGAQIFSLERPPDDWGYGLPVVYAVWIGVVIALYPACRWFSEVKRRHRSVWLSYL